MKNVLVWALAGLALASLCGCRSNAKKLVYTPPAEPGTASEPVDPDKALEEQLRSGTYQLQAALDSVTDALEESKRASKSLSGDAKEAVLDVTDFLDDAGGTVAESCTDPPDAADIKKDFAAADDERKKRISAANDAYRDLEEALGTVKALKEQYEGLGRLQDLVSLALDDMGDAIEALGGTVESEEAADGGSGK